MSAVKRAGAAAAVVLALVLSGCAADGIEKDSSTDRLREETITLQDGRVVHCIVYKSGYAGGLSCDFEGVAR